MGRESELGESWGITLTLLEQSLTEGPRLELTSAGAHLDSLDCRITLGFNSKYATAERFSGYRRGLGIQTDLNGVQDLALQNKGKHRNEGSIHQLSGRRREASLLEFVFNSPGGDAEVISLLGLRLRGDVDGTMFP